MRWRTVIYSRPLRVLHSRTPSPMATWRPSRPSSASSPGSIVGGVASLAGCWTRSTGGSERRAAGSRSFGRTNRSRGTGSTNLLDTGTSTALISPRRGLRAERDPRGAIRAENGRVRRSGEAGTIPRHRERPDRFYASASRAPPFAPEVRTFEDRVFPVDNR